MKARDGRAQLEHLIPAHKKTIQWQIRKGGQLYFLLFENIYFVTLDSKIQGETLKR
jgi:hypothetical protein